MFEVVSLCKQIQYVLLYFRCYPRISSPQHVRTTARSLNLKFCGWGVEDWGFIDQHVFPSFCITISHNVIPKVFGVQGEILLYFSQIQAGELTPKLRIFFFVQLPRDPRTGCTCWLKNHSNLTLSLKITLRAVGYSFSDCWMLLARQLALVDTGSYNYSDIMIIWWYNDTIRYSDMMM